MELELSDHFDRIIEGREKIRHWEGLAEELVIECLIRAGVSVNRRSLIGHIAHKELWRLARSRDKKLYYRVLRQRDRVLRGASRVMGELLG